ncbi:uncharacterized protein Z519_10298 [Cladophialophora bantiana CBS 173.52]|uniref:Uncharacterized protein n=1 Tax=Cladophialophora bantiana (strain ATCC 10958 / CBS 173.52 / CDC B-1940 / NIH 8579) TaxID=1442370 RepID=A0A0D2HW57_CLAB1|nr:uncharacterized protein Z519_10298 [Cladophialophora bantiana CBS 173.52]KIW88814.1 hypothetical protein Z519_10298 [Cladophialophora bantiana CBS 173.52]
MSATMVGTTTRDNIHITVPADYLIYHPDSPPNPSGDTTSRQPLVSSGSRGNNPPHWPDDRRRIPDYRPVNKNLDQQSRRTYRNVVERAFIANMFRGVSFNAWLAQTWRATGGRFNSKIFQYKIGGEW